MSVASWAASGTGLLLLLVVIGFFFRRVRAFYRRVQDRLNTALMAATDRLSKVWHKLESGVIWTSRPFLTGSPNFTPRWVSFLAWYSLIYTLAAYASPPVAFFAVLWGLWSVISINRAWVRNETLRSRIARKIIPHHVDPQPPETSPAVPDEDDVVPLKYPPREEMLRQLRNLPDLRPQALFAGLKLFVLLPLLFLALHEWCGIFTMKDKDLPLPPLGFSDTFWYILDKTYLKSILDSIGLGSRHTPLDAPSQVEWFLAGVKLLIYIFLITTIHRLIHIREDIQEGIEGAEQDAEMAVLLGHRAYGRLVRHISSPPENPIPSIPNALDALGKLREPRAAKPIIAIAEGANAPLDHRYAATLALGQMLVAIPAGPQKPKFVLMSVYATLKEMLRRGNADDDRHLPLKTLEVLLKSGIEGRGNGLQLNLREAAAIALGMIDDGRAWRILLDRLKEIQNRIGDRSVEADPVVIKTIINSLGEHLNVDRTDRPTEADVQQLITLITKPEDTELPPLKKGTKLSLLENRYLRVRNRAVTVLGKIRNPDTLVVIEAMVEPNDNPKLLTAIANSLGQFATAALDTVHREIAIRSLIALLEKAGGNSSITLSALAALEAFARIALCAAAREAIPKIREKLVEAYQHDDIPVSLELSQALGETFQDREQAEEIHRCWSLSYLDSQMELLMLGKDPTERKTAAGNIQALNHTVAAKLLEDLEENLPVDDELRLPVHEALERVRRGIAEAQQETE